MTPLMAQGEMQLYKFADLAGVYAVYCKEGNLQYIGLSRKVSMPVAAGPCAGSMRAGRPTMHADPTHPLPTRAVLTDRRQRGQPHD